MAIGAIIAVTPSTIPILAILDPNAFPTAKPEFPCKEEIPDTKISGAEVPNPTIVNPITKDETPICLAIETAPETK
jgi:hypothetical protein